MAARSTILSQLRLAQYGNARQIARAFAKVGSTSVTDWCQSNGWSLADLQVKVPATAVEDLANYVANEACDPLTIDEARAILQEKKESPETPSPKGDARPGKGGEDREGQPQPAPAGDSPAAAEGEGSPADAEGDGDGRDPIEKAFDTIRDEIESRRGGQPLSEEEREAIKNEVLEDLRKDGIDGVTKEIRVIEPDGKETPKEGLFHYKTPLVLAAIKAAQGNSISAAINILLVGEAGSGKTKMAEVISQILGFAEWLVFSCNPFTTKGDVVGIYDVNGNFNWSAVMKAVTRPGLVFFDELDRCHPGAAIPLQSLLANRYCFLPDGTHIVAHKDCVMLAGANTWGTGANDVYSSANRMDAATMDRFFGIVIDYDWGLAAAICGIEGRPSPALKLDAGGVITEANEWADIVVAAHEAAGKEKINTVISPRAMQAGIALSEQGIGKDWLLRGLIFKGLKKDQVDRLIGASGGKVPKIKTDGIAAKV